MNFLGQPRLDPLLLGSPLRSTPVAVAIAGGLLVLLATVAETLLAFLRSLRGDVANVFIGAIALSTLMSVVPLAILW